VDRANRPETLVSLNPSTLEPIGEVPITEPGRLPDIVKRSERAFERWGALALDDRVAIVRKAQDIMLAEADQIARMVSLEMGRPFTESFAIEAVASIDLLYYYWKHAYRFLRDRRVSLHNPILKRASSYIHFQPLGVMGNVAPWNWPLLIPLGVIVPALLAGDTLVYKPSEFAPLTGEMLREIFIRAGVPPDAYINIHGTGTVGEALVRSDVAKVFFTGSTRVGQMVMEQAASDLKKVVLELGGHDPAIVCEDANVEIASSGVLWGAMGNCGQNCNAIERVYAHRRVYDRLVAQVAQKCTTLRVGDPFDATTDIGPVATEGQLSKMRRIVDQARQSGMEVLAGGNSVQDAKGTFFEPTVIACTKEDSPIPDEEVFGPVMFIKRVEDDEEAVRRANSSRFALSASVWTTDSGRGTRIAGKIESGSVMINDSVVLFGVGEAGWTGIKKSGVGWMHGEKGIDEMVNMQFTYADAGPDSQKLWWFPYSKRMVDTMRNALVVLFSRNLFKRIAALPGVLDLVAYLFVNKPKKGKM
jgi:acyl-CoA reductase-like NAD-dependent aldehyde dehydrogenase